MPRAMGIAQEEKFDLKSLPGGYVMLRRMTYGEKMERQGRMSGLKVQAQKGSKNFEGEIVLANRRVTEYEFAICVLDHNLFKDEEETQRFDFKNPTDLVLLDGKIGEEIAVYIDRLNQFTEEDEELGNSQTGSDRT